MLDDQQEFGASVNLAFIARKSSLREYKRMANNSPSHYRLPPNDTAMKIHSLLLTVTFVVSALGVCHPE
jgi:hypothetical protein